MLLSLKCPKCGEAQQVSDEVLGQKLSCPSCGAGFRVSAPKPKASPAPDPSTIPLVPETAIREASSPVPQPRSQPVQPRKSVPKADPQRGGFPSWAYALLGGGGVAALIGIAVVVRTFVGSGPGAYPDPAADIALGVASPPATPLAQSGLTPTPPLGASIQRPSTPTQPIAAPARPIAAPAQPTVSMRTPAPTQTPGNAPPANTSTTAPAPPANVALASSTTPKPAAPVTPTTPPPTSPAPSTTPAPNYAGGTLTTAQIVAKCEASVALVKGGMSSGTGFLVRPGIIATNSHVIDDEFISSLEVRFPSAPAGKQGPHPAELLYEDPKRDLAFLSVSTDLPALEVAPSYAFTKGEDITVIGNPGLSEDKVLENAISRGVMSSKVVLDGLNYFQMGISVNPGNSGGPVFDSAGRVIGVTTLKSSKQEALAFCIPIQEVQAALNQLGTPHLDQVAHHRASAAFQALSATGALYGIGLEIRAVLLAQTPPGAKPNLLPNEGLQKLDEIIGVLDDKLFPVLEQELPGLQSDNNLPTGPRGRFQELMACYKAMRDLYPKTNQPTDRYMSQVQSLRTKYVRLLESLQKDLNIAIPAELMAILKARVTAGQSHAMVAQLVPAHMQSRILRNRGRLSQRNAPGSRNQPGSGAGQSARDRMQNLRDRARSRTRGNN